MMARRHIVSGIDIGTSSVRVIIAEYTKGASHPVIIGTGVAESKGLRHGYIVHPAESTESILQAKIAAERAAGVSIKRAFVAVGGLSVESDNGAGSVFVSRADGQVMPLDVSRATESAEERVRELPNREIIHAIPIGFKLDGADVYGNPIGMKGSRLEVRMLFVTCLRQHLEEFVEAVEGAGISVEDIMASPIAASFVTLTKRQKTAGVLLANLGAETLSIVVFENNIPVSLKVFPIGGVEITNDIALGLKIPLEEAEQVKMGMYVNAYPKKKLEDIIGARLSDIFDIINSHLKKIDKQGLLPAGIIITGGTSAIPFIEELAKNSLKLPAKIAMPDLARAGGGKIADASWSVAYGLCIMGAGTSENESAGIKLAKKTRRDVVGWIKQFLP